MKKILKHGKQVLAFLLVVILTTTLLPTEYLSNILPEKLPWMVKAADIVHSGTDGDLTWSIDSEGCLRISGSGDYKNHAWTTYHDEIKTAVVNVDNITSAHEMFSWCSSLTSLDLSELDTSKVTSMEDMFCGCNSLTSLNLSGFDTVNVKDMTWMFNGCSSLTSLDLSGFNTTKVTYMSGMFMGCNSLTSLNLSGFDTSSVKSVNGMFMFCSSLTSLNLSWFDTSKVETMRDMFSYCNSLTSLDLSGFDTSRVMDMEYMFCGCSSLTSLNLASFDITNVLNVDGIFGDCSHLSKINTPINTDSEKGVLPEADNLQWTDTSGKVCIKLPGNIDHSIVLTRGGTGGGGNSELINYTSKYSLNDTYSFTNGKASGRISLNMLNKFFKPLNAYSLWSENIGADGVCYGMAVSAMASSVYDSPIASSYGKNKLYDVMMNTISTDTGISAKEYVQYAFVSQYTEQAQKERQDLGKSDLNGLYKAVEDNVFDNGEPVSIAIRGDKNNYGHRLWAIGIGENNSEKTEIKVYDCNYPGENCYLTLNKEGGNYTSWEYTLKPGMVWGTGRVNASILYYNPAESFVGQYGRIKNDIPQIGESRPLLTIDNTTSKISTTKGEETEISPDMEDGRFLYIQTDDVVIDSEMPERKSYSYWADLPDKMTVVSTEDTICSVSAGKSALKLDMPKGAEAEFSVSDAGNNSADISKVGDEDFEISYFNAESEDEIDQVTFSSEGREQIQSIQTEEGIEIKSDNLSGLKVSRTEIDKNGNNVKLAEAVVPTNAQNILVKDNNNALLIKEDSDNDGDYDNVITQIPFQKKTEEEPKKTTSLVNTVTDSKVFVSKIRLEGISHNISSGKKITLKADITPANATIKRLTWSTSNPKVANVTQTGVVTLKKKTGGKSVTITATAADGSGISASWKIKSMKGVVKKIAVTGAKTVKAGKSLKLKAKVTATKGANKKLKWTSSNTKYATVTSSGKVKTFKAGKGKMVKITAMATDGSNKKKTVTIKIK